MNWSTLSNSLSYNLSNMHGTSALTIKEKSVFKNQQSYGLCGRGRGWEDLGE